MGPSRYEDLLRRAQRGEAERREAQAASRLRTVAEDDEEMHSPVGDDFAVDPSRAEPLPAASSGSTIAQHS